MRLLTSCKDSAQQQRLADYLLAKGIPNKILDDELWVVEEDQLPQAKDILVSFQNAPNDPKFSSATQTARQIRQQEAEAEARFRQNYFRSGDLWGQHSLRQVPVTVGIIIISVVTSVLAGFGSNKQIARYLYFAEQLVVETAPNKHPTAESGDPELDYPEPIVRFDAKGLKQGEIWRLLTPIFLHFNFMHLLFNMMCFYSLAGMLEYRRGAGWLIGFVLVTGIVSNLAQYLFPSLFDLHFWRGQSLPGVFAGMSGVCYALFGYLALKMWIAPEASLAIPSSMVYLMLIWLIACMTGWLGSIANTAHVAGLMAGMILATAGWSMEKWNQRRR